MFKMCSHGLRQLVTTSLLQVVNRLVASCLQTCCKFITSTRCNLFQQVVTSLQMTSCNKPDLNRLIATWWNCQACCNLLTSWNKLVKLTTCNKSVMFFSCVDENYKPERSINLGCLLFPFFAIATPYMYIYIVNAKELIKLKSYPTWPLYDHHIPVTLMFQSI